jgi:hypothetical protein
MDKIKYFLTICGSFKFFTEFFSVVYEGESINVFGYAVYHTTGDYWYIEPLSLSY